MYRFYDNTPVSVVDDPTANNGCVIESLARALQLFEDSLLLLCDNDLEQLKPTDLTIEAIRPDAEPLLLLSLADVTTQLISSGDRQPYYNHSIRSGVRARVCDSQQ